MNQFIIAAAASNSGKTTLTMGLLRALSNRGLKVQAYKCGPDYIDPIFHQIAAHQVSINLDTFMASCQHIQSIFRQYGQKADVRVVEGVMGMFDGYDKGKGSCAELAVLLNLPVVLIVNAKSMAYSVAPLIYGFKHFDPRIQLAGVVFNMVGSNKHFRLLQQACADAGTTCLGYLKKNENLQISSRHLGLTIGRKNEIEHFIQIAAEEVEQHVDIDKILAQ